MRNLRENKLLYAFFGILFAVISLTSCGGKTFHDKDAFLTYLRDESNGYLKHKTVHGVDYSLMYRPTDLLVLQELPEKPSQKQIEALRKKYGKYLYFNLSMSKNEKELLSVAPNNMNEFAGMVNTLSFGMREKVHLYNSSKDTLEMTDFVYPRMYGMSKTTTIMFVFPRDEEKLKGDYLNFSIQDMGLLTGEVNFKIPLDNIKNEPTIY
jgi:hypothetical protein